MKALHRLAAAEAVGLLSRREISSEELARACLDRINAQEAAVQAWQFINPEQVLARARALDSKPTGPLFGLPIAIKDIIETADMPCEYGSSIYRGHRPLADAECVAALRRSGALILGKTVTTEFAYFTPGKTRNPHQPGHTPGGSSSGSAAAVAAFMVPASLGTQTAGSIIRPASFCGVLGYKPTFGELPMAGIRPLAPSLDTLGIFARSVSDLPLISQAIRGKQRPLPILRGPPRIGLCRTEQWPLADPDSQRVVLESVDRLRDAGAHVEEIELGDSFHGLFEAQRRAMAVEASQALKLERERHPDALGRKLHELFEEADACSPEAYRSALRQAEECRRQMLPIFAKHEVLITPSAPGEAPAGLEATGDPVFNRIWTMLHLPCISLPVGKGRKGLPIGIQAIGEAGGDVRLQVFADWIHSRLPATA